MSSPAPAEAAPSDSAPTSAPAGSRQERALEVVRANMAWSAGAGILPFPLFDMVAITAVQLKVIKEISDVYEVPFRESAAKAVVASLLGALGSGALATVVAVSALKFIPYAGPFLACTSLAATSAALTCAMGRVFIKHFEAGGNLLDLDPTSIREYFRQEFEKGLKEAESNGDAADKKKKRR